MTQQALPAPGVRQPVLLRRVAAELHDLGARAQALQDTLSARLSDADRFVPEAQDLDYLAQHLTELSRFFAALAAAAACSCRADAERAVLGLGLGRLAERMAAAEGDTVPVTTGPLAAAGELDLF